MPQFINSPAPQTNFKTYSFRLECSEDYTAFIVAADKKGIKVVTTELQLFRPTVGDHAGPDTYVEFVSESSLEELRDALRDVPDSHVALQTLRQTFLKNNSLERDYDLR